jgi:hypothetical protein
MPTEPGVEPAPIAMLDPTWARSALRCVLTLKETAVDSAPGNASAQDPPKQAPLEQPQFRDEHELRCVSVQRSSMFTHEPPEHSLFQQPQLPLPQAVVRAAEQFSFGNACALLVAFSV